MDTTGEGSNRLGRSASPYLRQHADKPVHWHVWGGEAFEEARQRDVPVLLSIGYAACHWCHVMAHESFEDPGTARIMNERFVNVKVDREERPDVDQIYMSALHALGEQGGWPLTMFLDGEERPFWGGTYFPPEARHGLPAFRTVLEAVSDTWRTDRARVTHNVSHMMDHLAKRLAPPDGSADVGTETLDTFADNLLDIWDMERGGPKGAPKFPNAPMVETLWRAWKRTGRIDFRDAVHATTASLQRGGIHDQFGGGLHRYTVDGRWLVPHFEKMLYDQTHALRQVFWSVGDASNFAASLVDWVERDLRTSVGLAASLDADSGGEEGTFYTWTVHEVRDALGGDAETIIAAYDLDEAHFEGRAIPNRLHARAVEVPKLEERTKRLRIEREKRVAPPRDDKVLTDWNMAFVATLSDAGVRTGRAEWIADAERIFHAVLTNDAGERIEAADLHHSRLRALETTHSVAPALLSDHVETMHAALALLGAGGGSDHLSIVEDHLTQIVRHYLVDGLPVLTHSDVADIPVRPSAFEDDPNPSPASQLLKALTVLEELGEAVPNGLGERLERALATKLAGDRFGIAGAANALDHRLNAACLVVLGDDGGWARAAAQTDDPNLFIVQARAVDDLPPNHAARALGSTKAPVAVLCRNRTCGLPLRSKQELLAALVR